MANFEVARQALNAKRISQIEEAIDLALSQLKPLIKAQFLVMYPYFSETYRMFKRLSSSMIILNIQL